MSDRAIVLRAHPRLNHWLLARAIIVISGLLLVLLSVPAIMRAVSDPYTFLVTDDIPFADTVLIPGASVGSDGLSPVYLARVQIALQLYRSGKAKRILISGDAEPNYDEVTPARNVLLSAGVPLDVIVLDTRGYDTYSSMFRARWVYDVRKLIVVSQDFHLPRSIFVARSLGIDASGLRAPGGTFNAYLREIPASWKALGDLLLNRQPKFLEAPLPLASV